MTINPIRLLSRLINYIYYKLGDKTTIALYKIYESTKNNELNWDYHPKCKDTLVSHHKGIELHIRKLSWCYLRIMDYTDKNNPVITSFDNYIDGEIVERIYEEVLKNIKNHNLDLPKTKREILVDNILRW